MTPTYLTGYVQSIVDHKKIYDHVDPEKDITISVEQLRNEWQIKASFIGEIRLTAWHDPDARGVVQYDPEPVRSEDYFFWSQKEGLPKLHKEVEQMIERINKIEL